MNKHFVGLIACMAMFLTSLSAQADMFKFGLKGGVNLQELTLNDTPKSLEDAKNLVLNKRCGWQAGVTAQFTLPVIGLGAEVSALYSHRTSEVDGRYFDNNFFSVPVHAIYKIDIPVVNQVIAPYVFAGPDFAFRLSDDSFSYPSVLTGIATNGQNYTDELRRIYTTKKYNVGLDLGLGVELFQHLQVSACYTIGLNSAMKYYEVGKIVYDAYQSGQTGNVPTTQSADDSLTDHNWEGDSSIKNTGWTINVAYMF